MAQANIKAVITADDRASATIAKVGDNVEGTGAKIAKSMKIAAAATAALAVSGIGLAVKASWDQVDAVQQATVGLKAYEKNTTKVNRVLKNLLKYARSDMGVLFNRKDLFQSAQSLKIMGDNTGDLVKHVKILSRSVGLGLSNWEELNLIVGRVGSTGRLTGEDFDNLTKAGYKLSPSIRNTDQTFQSLFKHLDKGIPVDALNGQANTIKGLSIRLQTAFRGVGDAILGVDAETNMFVKNGLGARLSSGLSNATGLLKEFKKPISDTTKTLLNMGDSIYKRLSPSFSQLGYAIGNKLLPAINKFLSSDFARTIGVVLVSALDIAIRSISVFIRLLGDFISQSSYATSTLVGLISGFSAYQAVIQTLNFTTMSFTKAQSALNMVMRLNPYALLIAAVVGITAAYITAVNQTNNSSNATIRLKAAQDALHASTNRLKLAEQALSDARLAQMGTALGVERAQKNYNEAVRQFGPKSLEAREALYQLRVAEDGHKRSLQNTKNEIRNVQKAETDRANNARMVKQASDAVRSQINKEAGAWLGLGKSINQANAEAGKKPTYGGHIKVPKAFSLPGRASGGPVRANSPYMVGEEGPELFMPNSSGNIISHDKTKKLSQPGNININLNVGAFMGSQQDARKFAKMIMSAYQDSINMNGQMI